jgi:hypothetical protein
VELSHHLAVQERLGAAKRFEHLVRLELVANDPDVHGGAREVGRDIDLDDRDDRVGQDRVLDACAEQVGEDRLDQVVELLGAPAQRVRSMW